MLSKIKKSVAVGLSAVLAVSLSCGVCAAKENDPDTGCSRELLHGWYDPCLSENRRCARACFEDILSGGDKTRASCGEQQIDATPSPFIGRTEVFQRCMEPLSFWKKWEKDNCLALKRHPVLYGGSVVAGACSLYPLGYMAGGVPGLLVGSLLSFPYLVLFLGNHECV